MLSENCQTEVEIEMGKRPKQSASIQSENSHTDIWRVQQSRQARTKINTNNLL